MRLALSILGQEVFAVHVERTEPQQGREYELAEPSRPPLGFSLEAGTGLYTELARSDVEDHR